MVIEYMTFIVYTLVFNFISDYNFDDLAMLNMVEPVGQNNSSDSSNVNPNVVEPLKITRIVQDVYTHGTWPDAIRTLFIYGAGANRIRLSRNPRNMGWTMFGTLATDLGSQAVKRAFDDPTWLKAHIQNFKLFFSEQNELHVQVSETQDVVSAVSNTAPLSAESVSTVSSSSSTVTNTYLPLNNYSSNLFYGIGIDVDTKIATLLKYFDLKPVRVDYSPELLADQHYLISIGILILSVTAILLLTIFILNMILYSYRDKLLSYFKNKYIIAYINLTTKYILGELIFISVVLYYNFYYIIIASKFLMTHPLYFYFN